MNIVGDFQRDFRVSSYEINPRGYARLSTIANYLQETANEHAMKLGWGYHDLLEKQVGWVLSRMRIKVHKYPVWNDVVKVDTWPRGVEKLFALRDFQILNAKGELVAEATTYWLIIDLKTHRPQRTPTEFLDVVNRPIGVFEQTLGKIPVEESAKNCSVVDVKYTDLDIVGHVNNVKYIEWCTDALDYDLLLRSGIHDFEINFMQEARIGNRIEITCAPTKENSFFMGGNHIEGGKESFRALLRLK